MFVVFVVLSKDLTDNEPQILPRWKKVETKLELKDLKREVNFNICRVFIKTYNKAAPGKEADLPESDRHCLHTIFDLILSFRFSCSYVILL